MGLVREVIVVDAGSQDATLKIARDVGCKILHGEKGRGRQIALGMSVAQGSWAWILHADSSLQTGWSEGFSLYLRQPDKA